MAKQVLSLHDTVGCPYIWASKPQDPKLVSNLEQNCQGNQLTLRRSLLDLPIKVTSKYVQNIILHESEGQFFANISKIKHQINMRPKLFDSPGKNLHLNLLLYTYEAMNQS